MIGSGSLISCGYQKSNPDWMAIVDLAVAGDQLGGARGYWLQVAPGCGSPERESDTASRSAFLEPLVPEMSFVTSCSVRKSIGRVWMSVGLFRSQLCRLLLLVGLASSSVTRCFCLLGIVKHYRKLLFPAMLVVGI